MTTTGQTTIWAKCINCGEHVQRTPGMRHGDGQVDTDDSPVWTLVDEQMMIDADIDIDKLDAVDCGCNA